MFIQKNFLIIMAIILLSISSKAEDFDYYQNIYIEKIAKSYLGTKYVWGGNGRRGYDCSGFTKEVFEENGIELPRNSWKQAKVGKWISRKNLQKGDLIFFNSKHEKRINHVGIYLGHGLFIHASHFHKKIVISKFKEYKRYFQWGRRLT